MAKKVDIIDVMIAVNKGELKVAVHNGFFTLEHTKSGERVRLNETDAEQVVRCKDCKHFVSPQGVPCCDEFMGLGFPNADGSDFCSYGERKDNEVV